MTEFENSWNCFVIFMDHETENCISSKRHHWNRMKLNLSDYHAILVKTKSLLLKLNDGISLTSFQDIYNIQLFVWNMIYYAFNLQDWMQLSNCIFLPILEEAKNFIRWKFIEWKECLDQVIIVNYDNNIIFWIFVQIWNIETIYIYTQNRMINNTCLTTKLLFLFYKCYTTCLWYMHGRLAFARCKFTSDHKWHLKWKLYIYTCAHIVI